MDPEYIFHTTKKNGRIAIFPPTIEEVLNENFNYPDYIEKYAKQNSELDDFLLLYQLRYKIPVNQEVHMRSPLEDSLVQNGLYDNYKEDMRNIQKQYEIDLLSKLQTMDYNKEMKIIAQNYYNQIVNKINHQGKQK